MYATLWSVDDQNELIQEETDNLMGKTIAESRYLYNEKHIFSTYFIFPNLVIQRKGKYKLLFRLLRVTE
ncbi:hypothetical protein BC833DRAFT_600530 [Globomyces pollinis-pini]|nr:hypothetical protein BC833DRAFT_600530 [Globomyces pollinis-pini]